MNADTLFLLMALVIFLLTLASGAIPFVLKSKNPAKFHFPIGEALASGVFLGAGLVHMLSDASDGFAKLGFDYPWAFTICGLIFLVFLVSEHIGFFAEENSKNQSLMIAVASTIMLSIHSFLAGAALGITTSVGFSVILFLAILAHKWAASFSLAVYINKAQLKLSRRIIMFGVFSLMVPLGIYFGDLLHHQYIGNQLLQPIFSSVAAGTFVYLGTLHGFKALVAGKTKPTLTQYFYVLAGFALMVVVAIWL